MPNDNPPTKRDKATARRKRTILEAAVTCFIETGYHQTGMRNIAKQAGVSLGNLYNYFSGKTDILADIATIERQELDPFLEILAKDAPALDVLDEFLPAYARHLAAPETVILGLEITCEALRQPSIADLFLDSRNTLISALTDLLLRGAQEGTMRETLNTTETAYLILEILEGSAFRHGVERVPFRNIMKNQVEFVHAAVIAT